MRHRWLAGVLVLAVACTSKSGSTPSSTSTTTGPTSIPPPAVVPDVVGTDESGANQDVSAAGFQPVVESTPAPEASGKVIAQSPDPGTELAPGSSVDLVVSQGWPTVPDFNPFTGIRLAREKRLLRDQGLRVGEVVSRYHWIYSLYSPNKVFSSRPSGSTKVRPGRVVTLIVAKPYACTPGYSPCLPPGAHGFQDYDCAGGEGNGPLWVYTTERITGSDIYELDRDYDGWGCE